MKGADSTQAGKKVNWYSTLAHLCDLEKLDRCPLTIDERLPPSDFCPPFRTKSRDLVTRLACSLRRYSLFTLPNNHYTYTLARMKYMFIDVAVENEHDNDVQFGGERPRQDTSSAYLGLSNL